MKHLLQKILLAIARFFNEGATLDEFKKPWK